MWGPGSGYVLESKNETGTRKPNGVVSRLASKSIESYPSQRLWGQVPGKSMTQKPGKVPRVEGLGLRNSLLELTVGNQEDLVLFLL